MQTTDMVNVNDKEVFLDTLADCRLTASVLKVKNGRQGNLVESMEDLIRALDKAAEDVTGERRYLQRCGQITGE